MRLRRWTAGAVLGLLVLAGCSDDKGGGDAASPTTARPTATTTAQRISGGPFCEFALTFTDRFGRITPDAASPQRLRTTFEEAIKAIDDAEATAPAEIKADVRALSATFHDLYTILQQAGFDFTKVTPASFQRLQSPENQAASQRLDNYISQNCRAG